MNATRLAVMVISLTVAMASLTFAETPAEWMEKGIYTEDTIGNLDEAIKIYRKIVSEAKETEALAAKAQYRLGNCLLKLGKKDEAIEAFESLIKRFPEQTTLVDKAKSQLPTALAFGKEPWKDGETLTMRMRLAGGQDIGLIGVGVHSAKLDGEDTWEMTIRRYVDGANNEGVSKVWVDKTSFRPKKTIFDHTVLGSASSTWTEDELVVIQANPGKAKKESKIPLDATSYSNDQVFYGFRQLPLEVGYETTIPIRVAFTGGNALGLEVSVEEKETIETPAGTFDCFRLDTNIQQTFWVADVPERYIVQFEAGGVTAQLESIGSADKERTFKHEAMGFECTVPKGWFFVDRVDSNGRAGGVQLVAPEMASVLIYVKEKSLLKEKQRVSLKAWMEDKIERTTKALKGFEIDEKGIQKTKAGELDALAINSSHKMAKRDVQFGLVLAFGESQSAQFSTSVAQAQAAAAQPQFDAIRNSFKLR